MNANEILRFWFNEIDSAYWWTKDNDFDEQIRSRFSDVYSHACQCELFHWRSTPEGRLAEIIVLDQFSRNMFRDTPKAFAQDTLALALAQEAVASGDHLALNQVQRSFVYLPYMHSESLSVHTTAVTLYEALGLEGSLTFEIKHKDIIERFRRYPHRNAILGRSSTEDEREFLSQPGSSF